MGDCPSKLRILNEEGCLIRPRLSPADQDLGSSATLYCYREQSGGGGSTEVLPSADVPDGEKPLKAKAHKVGQLNLPGGVRLPKGTRGRCQGSPETGGHGSDAGISGQKAREQETEVVRFLMVQHIALPRQGPHVSPSPL